VKCLKTRSNLITSGEIARGQVIEVKSLGLRVEVARPLTIWLLYQCWRTQYEIAIFDSVGRSARGRRQHPLGLMDLEQLSRVELQGVEGIATLASRPKNSIENTGYLV